MARGGSPRKPNPTVKGKLEPMGYEQITAAGAQGLASIPDGAQMILMQAEAADVRWRDDGTAPAAGVGMILQDGVAPEWYAGDLAALEFFNAGGSKVNISYYRS